MTDHADTIEATAATRAPGGIARPDTRFLFAHPANFIALGFGSGLSRFAPGTSGTLWAWALFAVWQRFASPAQVSSWTGWIIAASLPIGWWACTVCARNMRVADPGAIVWDEVVAFWLILWVLGPSAGFFTQLIAFALFRYFDAAKPGPVAWADSLFKGFGARGGFGILFDDLVAAFCTLLVFALWRFFF